jgi:hypothetical protein
LYGSTLIIKGNIGAATFITVEGAVSNNHVDIRAESTAGASCHAFNIASGARFEGTGMIRTAGCTGGNIIAGTGYLSVPVSTPTDGLVLSSLGLYPGSALTTVVATGDREDNAYPLSMLGMWSTPATPISGAYLWNSSAAHPDGNCLTLLGGSTTLTASTTDAQICQDGTVRTGLQGVTYSQLTAAPYSVAPNGSIVYCANCNATCTAAGGTGRMCFRENGAWTH